MAGHSKFKNIMHRKGRQDAMRSKLFSKLAREITVAAKMGTPDPQMNPRLRAAILAARAENMPRDNIDRALKKAAGNDDAHYEQIRYEGYGPGGVAFIIEALSDNRNRTAADVRAMFSKYGGNLGETGAVAFLFNHSGAIEYPARVSDANAMLEAAIEGGAEDVQSDEENHAVFCAVSDVADVAKALEGRFGEPAKSALVWRAQTVVGVDDETAEALMKFMSALDEHDDVQHVYANFELNDAQVQKLAS